MSVRSNNPFVKGLAILLVVVVFGLSACEDTDEAVGRITVVENSIDPQDPSTTIEVPLPQAAVRIYSVQEGTSWLEQNLTTDVNGQVEFSHPQDAILQVDVTHGGRQLLDRTVILEQGEIIEVTFNIDEQ